jgi:hypothetical protein
MAMNDKERQRENVALHLLQAARILLLPHRIGRERAVRRGEANMVVPFSFKQVRLLIHRYLLLTLGVITIALGGCTAAATSTDARSATAAQGKQAAADAACQTVPQSRECYYGPGGCYLETEFYWPMPCWLAVPTVVVLSPIILIFAFAKPPNH